MFSKSTNVSLIVTSIYQQQEIKHRVFVKKLNELIWDYLCRN